MVYYGCIPNGNKMHMKLVGLNAGPKVDVQVMDNLQKLGNFVRNGGPLVPQGARKCQSFEETETWMLKIMIQRSNPGFLR